MIGDLELSPPGDVREPALMEVTPSGTMLFRNGADSRVESRKPASGSKSRKAVSMWTKSLSETGSGGAYPPTAGRSLGKEMVNWVRQKRFIR